MKQPNVFSRGATIFAHVMLLAGLGFSAFTFYLSWQFYTQIKGTLALGVFNMGGSNATTNLHSMQMMFMETLLVGTAILILTFLFHFGYLYLQAWAANARSGRQQESSDTAAGQ